MLEVVSKSHLTPNYCVVNLLKMHHPPQADCAFSSAHALSLDAIWGFETTSKRFVGAAVAVFIANRITDFIK